MEFPPVMPGQNSTYTRVRNPEATSDAYAVTEVLGAPEEPAIDIGARSSVNGINGLPCRPVRKVLRDRARLPEDESVVLQNRNPVVGVHLEELRSKVRPLGQIDEHELDRRLKMYRGQHGATGIGGERMVIQALGVRSRRIAVGPTMGSVSV
jgi:hypothetical protein